MGAKTFACVLLATATSCAAADPVVPVFQPEVNQVFEVKTKDGKTRTCFAENKLGVWLTIRCLPSADQLEGDNAKH